MNVRKKEGTLKDVLTANEIVQEAGLEWFMGRAERYGFRADPQRVIVEGYRRFDGSKDR